MREIPFRGKRKTDGLWLHGDLRQWSETRKGICDYSLRGTSEVYPETVGQFTGLIVKEKQWFEHDIISVQLNGEEVYRFSIAFGNCGGASNVKHAVGYMGFYFEPANNETRRCVNAGLRRDPVYFINANPYECKVLGNIHDNPELLEG